MFDLEDKRRELEVDAQNARREEGIAKGMLHTATAKRTRAETRLALFKEIEREMANSNITLSNVTPNIERQPQ